MTKNITVIDENKNILYSTYPKRAKGLIKKGRAQWVGENAIQLCAPSVKEEAYTMAANIYEIFDNQISKMQEQLRDVEDEQAMPVRMQILKTMEVFRAQEQGTLVLDMVKAQLDTMQQALNSEEPTPENALARETTRQKMLELLNSFLKGDAPKTGEAESKDTSSEFSAG